MSTIQPEDVMEQLNATELKAIGRKLNLPKNITRKGDLIEMLLEMLQRNPSDIIAHCTNLEETFLAEAAYNDGIVNPDTFLGKYGKPCPGKHSYSAYGEKSKDASVFNLLVYHEEDGDRYIAPCVAKNIKTLLSPPIEVTLQATSEIRKVYQRNNEETPRPVQKFSGEHTFFTELRRILSLVQAGKISVAAKSKRPTDASVRKMSEALALPDYSLEMPEPDRWTETCGPVRAYAWGVLLQQCGWGKPKGSKLELTRIGKKLMSNITAEDIRTGYNRFLKDDEFDELNRIKNIKGQGGKGKRKMTQPSDRKMMIDDSISQWTENQWVSFDDAFRFVLASGNSFNVSRHDAWHLYFEEQHYGSLGYDGTGDGLERQYLRVFFMESLATLGLVDIAYVYPHRLWPEFGDRWGVDDMCFCGRYDGLLYVRLNALGAYCFGITDNYEPPEVVQKKLFKVLANLDIALVENDDISVSHRCTLELFARPKSDYVWKIDKKHIIKYIESGGTIKEIRNFLTNNTTTEIPQPVKVYLDDIDKKLSAVCGVTEAIIIEMTDKVTAALIAHDKVAGKLCNLAGKKHLAVPKKNERAFRNALKKMGYVLPQ